MNNQSDETMTIEQNTVDNYTAAIMPDGSRASNVYEAYEAGVLAGLQMCSLNGWIDAEKQKPDLIEGEIDGRDDRKS